QLAIQHRLPTMFIFRTYVEAGGLTSYGATFVAMRCQAAIPVAKTLTGDTAAAIPIARTHRFQFPVNLTTVKDRGIEVPTSILLAAEALGSGVATSVLLRADEVIE